MRIRWPFSFASLPGIDGCRDRRGKCHRRPPGTRGIHLGLLCPRPFGALRNRTPSGGDVRAFCLTAPGQEPQRGGDIIARGENHGFGGNRLLRMALRSISLSFIGSRPVSVSGVSGKGGSALPGCSRAGCRGVESGRTRRPLGTRGFYPGLLCPRPFGAHRNRTPSGGDVRAFCLTAPGSEPQRGGDIIARGDNPIGIKLRSCEVARWKPNPPTPFPQGKGEKIRKTGRFPGLCIFSPFP